MGGLFVFLPLIEKKYYREERRGERRREEWREVEGRGERGERGQERRERERERNPAMCHNMRGLERHHAKNEISQTYKERFCIISLICSLLWKKHTYIHKQIKYRDRKHRN